MQLKFFELRWHLIELVSQTINDEEAQQHQRQRSCCNLAQNDVNFFQYLKANNV